MSPDRSLALAVDLLGIVAQRTKGRPISEVSLSAPEREALEHLGVLTRELLRRTVTAPAFLNALPRRDFDQFNADGDRRYYLHGDLADAGTFYDARLDAFVLDTPVTTIAHAGDLARLKVQLRTRGLLSKGLYRPDRAPNVFAAHPLMSIPLRSLRSEAREERRAYLAIREAFVVANGTKP